MKKEFLLAKLKVIDLSTVLAGPSVGSFFAELGAEVTKIENSRHPDVTRMWKLPEEDKNNAVSAYFSSVNYRKKYLQIDYDTPEGRAALLSRIKTADVVLMNFKHGLQKKLGLEDRDLLQLNPELIIGKINGFGVQSKRVAYDLILQAETGFMAMNGTPEAHPVKMPVALIDVVAAHHLKQGILLELLKKQNTADYKGAVVSVSLYDAAISSLVNQASNYLMQNHIPQPIGSLHPNIAPYGEIFETADQKLITFAIGSDTHFEKFCDFLSLQELPRDLKFSTVQARVKNREELFKILLPVIKRLNSTSLLEEMHARHIPCGVIKDLSAVFESSRSREMIREEYIDGKQTRKVSSIAFKIKEREDI